MTDQPLTPTRIIPAGQTAALPGRAPDDGELPPWWEQTPRPGSPTAPAAAPPASPPPHREAPPVEAAPPPGVVEVRIRFQPDPVEPPRRWSWTWLTSRLHPWWTLLATIGVLVPWPWTGYSLATTWAYAVSQIRAEHGYGWGYTVAVGAAVLAGLYDERGRHWRVITRAVGVITLVGLLGAIHLYDPITLITGVQP